MVRKKSGEIVKSSLKCKSAPSTPTCPKFVHFNTELEHVRLFLKAQTPTSVKDDPPLLEDGDDDDDDDEQVAKKNLVISYPNWPVRSSSTEQLADMVSMESIQLADNQKSLVGRCQVANISFEKQVFVRYTFNYWQDTHEVEASYREPCGSEDASNSAFDRFMFNLPLRGDSQSVFLCIKYVVNDREFWDNNLGRNYQVDVVKPTNKKSSPVQRVSDDLPIKSRSDDSSLEKTNKLWNRYDFGASLSAAKRTTNTTTTTPTAASFKRVQSFPSYFSADVTKPDLKPYTPHKESATAPIAIPRPAPGTPSYFDLVNKYCFYGNESTIYSTSPSYSSTPAIRG